MVAAEDGETVGEGVDGGEEAPVQPSSSLQDQLRHGVGHVRLGLGRLDVLQDPVAAALGDELEAEDAILGEVHVGREDAGVGAVHLLAGKVLLERAGAGLVVLQRHVPIGREGPGQDRDEAEGRLQRLVEDVAHLVLEVLRRDQRVDQVLAAGAEHGLDLAASAGAHGLEVEGLPQVVDGSAAGSGPGVDEDADVRIQHLAERLKEPPMRVDLLLILLLQAEEHLNGTLDAPRGQFDDAVSQADPHLGCVLSRVRPRQRSALHPKRAGRRRGERANLVYVRGDVLAVDLLLRDAVLVDTHPGQDGTGPRVDLRTTVADDAHDNLLPRILAPGLAVGARAHVLDVLEDAAHGAGEEDVVLVVHGHDDEQLGVPLLREEALAQGEALLEELGRIARGGGVAHVRELVSLRGVGVRDLPEELWRDGAVQHQIPVGQLHFLDGLPPPDRWRAGGVAGHAVLGIVGVVLRGEMDRMIARIGPVRVVGLEDRSMIVVVVRLGLVVVALSGIVRQRHFRRRGVVRRVEVGVVVILWRDGVILRRVVVGPWRGRVMGFIFGVVTMGVVYVLDRVLERTGSINTRVMAGTSDANEPEATLTVGCACNRSPGPIGISRAPCGGVGVASGLYVPGSCNWTPWAGGPGGVWPAVRRLGSIVDDRKSSSSSSP